VYHILKWIKLDLEILSTYTIYYIPIQYTESKFQRKTTRHKHPKNLFASCINRAHGKNKNIQYRYQHFQPSCIKRSLARALGLVYFYMS